MIRNKAAATPSKISFSRREIEFIISVSVIRQIKLLELREHQYSSIISIKKKPQKNRGHYPGTGLLFRPVAREVPSALKGLTAEFGMGSGVAPSLEVPG